MQQCFFPCERALFLLHDSVGNSKSREELAISFILKVRQEYHQTEVMHKMHTWTSSRLMSSELEPLYTTCPLSTASCFISMCPSSWMRSTAAVTSMGGIVSGSSSSQCPNAMLPARLSRSSRMRAMRTLPHGFLYWCYFLRQACMLYGLRLSH